MSLALGFFVLRVFTGLLIATHGSQKAFGFFGGNGFAKTTGWLHAIGFRPAVFWTLLACAGEVGGGLLFAVGLLHEFAAVAIFASMLVAILKIHGKNGFWVTSGGYEYPLTLSVLSLVLGLGGPGAYALDTQLGLALPSFLFWVALVVAIAVVLGGVIASNRVVAQQSVAQKSGQQAA